MKKFLYQITKSKWECEQDEKRRKTNIYIEDFDEEWRKNEEKNHVLFIAILLLLSYENVNCVKSSLLG